jgi:glutamate dehydrogenase/leucine dehydrogenase
MKELLKKFEDAPPQIVFEWNDPPTGAKGWVVINSLRGGAAGGGTRMRKGLDMHEVKSLAKTMEVKFTVSGPPIGGAKSGIDFDPSDPRKQEVLERWYQAVIPLLKNYYGTGGDLNVDELHEVIPITEELGLWHPQEGVVNGHLQPKVGSKVNLIGQLRTGVSKKLEDPSYTPEVGKYAVADMITGWGVAVAVKHYYDIWGGDLEGKRAIVQGWGNVASAGAYYLSQMGAKIVGIIDRNGGLIDENGFSHEQITKLFTTKEGNALKAEGMIPFDEINDRIWDLNAEVFLPCAASRLITKEQIDHMVGTGLEVVSSGANVPFADPEIFYGPIAEHADGQVSVLPDFIANCGMARVFAYCMLEDAELTDNGIFEDASDVIKEALKKVHARNPEKTQLTKAAFEIALEQLT